MNKEEFIEAIGNIVVRIAPEFNILAPSAVIAQACLESAYGTSDKAKYHNYFGLKYRENRVSCHNGYFTAGSGEQLADGSYVPIETDWYSFSDMENGVRGYFEFTNISRYSNLKGVSDPHEYLELIKHDGYATSLSYVENVYRTLTTNNLQRFDNIAKKPVVCLDAGHYAKYNRCPSIPEYYESDMVWKLTNMQANYLRNLGIDVKLTRDDKDVDLGLVARGVESSGCDLFISNHSNAVGNGMNESVDYVAVYHLVDDGSNEAAVSKDFAEKIAKVASGIMETVQGYRVFSKMADGDRNGNGVVNDNYYGVLHGAKLVNTPGVIIEHSFHTNTRAVNWLLDDSNLERLASAEAKCIAEFLLGNNVSQIWGSAEPDNTINTGSDDVSDSSNNSENSVVIDKDTENVPSIMYYVQAGAFKTKDNADKRVADLWGAGFTAIVKKVGEYYKVQTGAFTNKAYADRMVENLKEAGFEAFCYRG